MRLGQSWGHTKRQNRLKRIEFDTFAWKNALKRIIFIGKNALEWWLFVWKSVYLQHKIVLKYAEKENRRLSYPVERLCWTQAFGNNGHSSVWQDIHSTALRRNKLQDCCLGRVKQGLKCKNSFDPPREVSCQTNYKVRWLQYRQGRASVNSSQLYAVPAELSTRRNRAWTGGHWWN